MLLMDSFYKNIQYNPVFFCVNIARKLKFFIKDVFIINCDQTHRKLVQ